MTSGMACHTLTVEFRRRVLPRQVAEKIGCSRESLRKEIRQVERDSLSTIGGYSDRSEKFLRLNVSAQTAILWKPQP